MDQRPGTILQKRIEDEVLSMKRADKLEQHWRTVKLARDIGLDGGCLNPDMTRTCV
jgi:hypothetical protein